MNWFNSLMRGASSRVARYRQYEAMDQDIIIYRALDIIAEEISVRDEHTELPFIIDYNVEDSQEVSEITTTTLRAALRRWAELQDLNNRVFRIARETIKFGDCFFRKKSDTKKWEYLDPTWVYGIEVNKEGIPVAYHISRQGLNVPIAGNYTHPGTTAAVNVEVVPAEAVIHFTLSDDMGPSAPFGESTLAPVFRTWRQLSMLEDATIIYLIVRAPERRVFYIDVGNMPAHLVKKYLESIKNDIRQKRVPFTGSPRDEVDSAYNPNSIQEDFFFPVTASGRSSRVETLPGGENLGMKENLLYFMKKILMGLRVPTSYLQGIEAQGAQYADGKVGVAYIEELRFANFVKRLQVKIEQIFSDQFKHYLDVAGIKVEPDLFSLRLPDPQNFALYRQAALDADLINTFNAVEGVKYLSRRFILKRYLGLTEDDIQMNEIQIKQERGISEDTSVTDLQQIYDPAVYENRDAVKIEISKEISTAPAAPSAEDTGTSPLELGFEEPAPPEETAPPALGGEEGAPPEEEAPPALT